MIATMIAGAMSARPTRLSTRHFMANEEAATVWDQKIGITLALACNMKKVVSWRPASYRVMVARS